MRTNLFNDPRFELTYALSKADQLKFYSTVNEQKEFLLRLVLLVLLIERCYSFA